jgi:hypothetical protein
VVSGDGSTTILRQLSTIDVERHGSPAIVRRIILERFLWVRQNTAEKVTERLNNNQINITTYMNYDAETNLICEDVFVESRAEVRNG